MILYSRLHKDKLHRLPVTIHCDSGFANWHDWVKGPGNVANASAASLATKLYITQSVPPRTVSNQWHPVAPAAPPEPS